jgi:hypothetical protein
MTKKALLCGINRYRVPGADLRGCVNDVMNLRAVLLDLFDFADTDIRMLIDDDATKANIEAGFTDLLAGAQRGDVLVFEISSHGSNVPDQNGDEPDRRDEILCPTDLDWRDPLRDDWLRHVIDGLPEGVNLTMITDCCYSGSVTRRLDPPDAPVIGRYLPSPFDLLTVESGRELTGAPRSVRRRLEREAGASDVVDIDLPEVLITGCRDNQTSADAFIDGDYHGAMTHALVTALRETGGNASYREIHRRMLTVLADGGFDQVPQIEGRGTNFDQPFLSPLA